LIAGWLVVGRMTSIVDGFVGWRCAVDLGRWLVERRVELDQGEGLWLAGLAEFDRDQLWALDGQFSCVSWLVWRTGMARSTAFDKLRVAHELARRPILAEALREGRVSYSAVRAITRIDRPDPDVDEALVTLAGSDGASITDVERAVRSWRLYADQDRPPGVEADRLRDVKIVRGDDGCGQVVITLGDLELEEFAATLQAFIDLRYRAVDDSSQRDPSQVEAPSRPAMRADAFMDLARGALAQADGGRAAGDDRYLVHLVARSDIRSMTTLEGRPLHPTDASMVACDTSLVAHAVGGCGEPLHLGRRTREWSSAQRRAIAVRDGGHCRFVGCSFARYDIHHITDWEHGGSTDVDNGCSMCRRHHRMLHSGYHMQGNPNGELRFYRPDGSYLGATHGYMAAQSLR
jgi:hypothetical protein